MQRDSLQFDIVIVGAGPAGLATACRLAQLAHEKSLELSIAVIEKGSEVGSHIVSGAVVDPRALEELFPDWQQRGAPLGPEVESESFLWLANATRARTVPHWLVPRTLHNRGNRIASLGRLCRWLAEQAEALGCDLLTGFAATELLFDGESRVIGVATGAQGMAADGSLPDGADPGHELRCKYLVLAEGCRGSLARTAEEVFDLRAGIDPQHYGIGFKEVWRIPAARHRPGHVEHTFGWPLDRHLEGGGFLYHADDSQLYVGFIAALNYRNPWFSPFDEFQRFKQHPVVRDLLEGATRTGFGARAVNKGGLSSLPRLSFPGGLLVGCDAGFLNGARLKGVHMAIKSGLLAADVVVDALAAGDEGGSDLSAYDAAFRSSWLYRELAAGRNFSAGISRLGVAGGGALAFIEQNILRGKPLFTLRQPRPDHASLERADTAKPIDYARPDNVVSFDRATSIHLASIEHREDQPCHLLLGNASIPIDSNLPQYAEPAQRYCPAGVYEIVEAADGSPQFRINAGNCIHCKTCDIKDPAQNIRWVPPEGGSGPNYSGL